MQTDALQEIAKSARNPYKGDFKLGLFPTLASYLLPHIIPALIKKFPDITFYLVEEKTAVLNEQLKQGKLDAAILALPIDEAGFAVLSLFKEDFLLAVPAQHTLAKRKILKQMDLTDQTLLLLEEGHCLREQALLVCQHTRAAEAKSFQATSLETLRYMVAAGTGITLIPRLACRPHKKIIYLPFATPKPSRTLGLVYRAANPRKILLTEMVTLICFFVKKPLTIPPKQSYLYKVSVNWRLSYYNI